MVWLPIIVGPANYLRELVQLFAIQTLNHLRIACKHHILILFTFK